MLAEKMLRKHVIIIHAYSLMSVLQRKIVNVLLYEAIKNKNRINHRSSVVVECCIPFSNLCKAIKFNSRNTQYLKEAIDGLASLKIEWNLLKDKIPTDISFLNLRILHGAPTFYQNNTINFSFHKIMLDLADNPSIYGTLDIDLQSDFESKYSHALYENSTRFVNLQKNKVIQLDIFRKILGVQENKFTNMRELTRNVIVPSIEEVNDRANFVVNLDAVKQGRKIIGFEFMIKNKKKPIKTGITSITDENEKIYNEIKQIFGKLSESILENILQNYPKDYILEKIAYTKTYAKKESSGFYPIAYFISAIKYDYKFKEEYQVKNLPEKIIDYKTQWTDQLTHLKSDLAHWERLLSYAKSGNNESQMTTIKTIILDCKEKLQQHYLQQPNKEEAR